MKFLFILFSFRAAVHEAQQSSHFRSAHGGDQQYTVFLSICVLYLKNKKEVNVTAILKCWCH